MEYIEESHTYLNKYGVIIPSVSKLIEFATGERFDNIPSYILEKAQNFGTHVHEAIQVYLETGVVMKLNDVYERLAFQEFYRLNDLKNPICEKMVTYRELYGGRLDILDGNCLIDIKTNSIYPQEHLEWQLGLYALALEEECIEVKNFKCLWLPKRKSGKWVTVTPKSKEDCLELVEQYLKHQVELAK